ncbi:ABC transporter substrate-binding protein [Mycobacterium tuberculosis]|uniref:ABC transporter substrate-binding protein n=1 Tax=Mycobacterium tuberculosis TaxID=1773 RepID=UPI00272A7FDA|nr:ABC transporter substrate-binding protein [Mycobacterium tuberculosis]
MIERMQQASFAWPRHFVDRNENQEADVDHDPPMASNVNYTSFELFLGAKVLVEGLRRAGPNPTRAQLIKAMEGMNNFDLGGTSVRYAPDNRVGSRYVEVTVIGSSGKLLK